MQRARPERMGSRSFTETAPDATKSTGRPGVDPGSRPTAGWSLPRPLATPIGGCVCRSGGVVYSLPGHAVKRGWRSSKFYSPGKAPERESRQSSGEPELSSQVLSPQSNRLARPQVGGYIYTIYFVLRVHNITVQENNIYVQLQVNVYVQHK